MQVLLSLLDDLHTNLHSHVFEGTESGLVLVSPPEMLPSPCTPV